MSQGDRLSGDELDAMKQTPRIRPGPKLRQPWFQTLRDARSALRRTSPDFTHRTTLAQDLSRTSRTPAVCCRLALAIEATTPSRCRRQRSLHRVASVRGATSCRMWLRPVRSISAATRHSSAPPHADSPLSAAADTRNAPSVAVSPPTNSVQTAPSTSRRPSRRTRPSRRSGTPPHARFSTVNSR